LPNDAAAGGGTGPHARQRGQLTGNTDAGDACAVLADVAGIGAYFVVGTDPAEAVDPTWRPLADLSRDPRPLRDRIAHVRRALGSDERVAASIAFQGLAALVVSAPFAAAVVHGVLPRLTPEALHWRASASGPWPLWCAQPSAVAVPEEDGAAAALADAVLDEQLTPLVAAVRAQVSVAERVLWGNVASSLAGAKRLVVGARPATAERAAGIAGRLLAGGSLAGAGELRPPEGPDRVWSFRRRSCCLYYRVPGGGLCGDCVLLRP
jgi:ferric iron reductase protein FhuF